MPRPPLADFLDKGRVYYCISSNVKKVSYDDEDEILYVTYKSGGEYAYLKVSELEARSFWFAVSKGKWIWSHIRVRGSKTLHQKPWYKLD